MPMVAGMTRSKYGVLTAADWLTLSVRLYWEMQLPMAGQCVTDRRDLKGGRAKLMVSGRMQADPFLDWESAARALLDITLEGTPHENIEDFLDLKGRKLEIRTGAHPWDNRITSWAMDAYQMRDADNNREWPSDTVRISLGTLIGDVRGNKWSIGKVSDEVRRTVSMMEDYGNLDLVGPLADAMEDMGASGLAVDHLRREGIHGPGCWVIEGLLEKTRCSQQTT